MSEANIHKKMLSMLKKIQWSSQSLDATGARMGFEEQDGYWRPSCPVCKNYRPEHDKRCELKKMITELEKEIK